MDSAPPSAGRLPEAGRLGGLPGSRDPGTGPVENGRRLLPVHSDGNANVKRPGGREGNVKEFRARVAEFTGSLVVAAPIEKAFALFSPLGELTWVPDWNPELLHPAGVDWARGQIFRTREETGEAVWIVTDLDPAAHRVEYHRVEPHRFVARVRVRCAPSGEERTEVSTAYAFFALSEEGNRDIEAMSDSAYADKMRRWERWIAGHLGRGDRE
jgi:Polyketide cyclase / dehydrase and lipid transport